MIRTILVPLAGDGASTVDALEAAGGIARGFGAHLVCLHVRTDGTAYVAALGGGMLASIPAEELAGMIDRDGDRRCQAARRQFDDFCGRRNIPVTSRAGVAREGLSAELLFDYGDPADALAGAGRVSDLIVMRRPDDTGLPQGMLHAALFETGRPLLLAGPRSTVTYDRIAIGWTPGREAARAVAAAAPFLDRAKAIEVVCVDAGADHLDDVIAVDAGADPRLLDEALPGALVTLVLRVHHLQRAALAGAQLLRDVDRAHAARGEPLQHAKIAPEDRTGCDLLARHGRDVDHAIA